MTSRACREGLLYHEERTYEVLTYDILLEQAGFKSFKLYADFEDKEPTKTSKRWFFVAQK